MPLGQVHELMDQLFATNPKSLFIQNLNQFLEITTNLH
jgi:hypothetical protein